MLPRSLTRCGACSTKCLSELPFTGPPELIVTPNGLNDCAVLHGTAANYLHTKTCKQITKSCWLSSFHESWLNLLFHVLCHWSDFYQRLSARSSLSWSLNLSGRFEISFKRSRNGLDLSVASLSLYRIIINLFARIVDRELGFVGHSSVNMFFRNSHGFMSYGGEQGEWRLGWPTTRTRNLLILSTTSHTWCWASRDAG